MGGWGTGTWAYTLTGHTHVSMLFGGDSVFSILRSHTHTGWWGDGYRDVGITLHSWGGIFSYTVTPLPTGMYSIHINCSILFYLCIVIKFIMC